MNLSDPNTSFVFYYLLVLGAVIGLTAIVATFYDRRYPPKTPNRDNCPTTSDSDSRWPIDPF